MENERLGRVILPGFPLHFAHAKLAPRWEFPELGRDTQAVIRGVLGYNAETYATLLAEGVLE